MRSPLYDYGRPEQQPNVYTPEMGTEAQVPEPQGRIPVTFDFNVTPASAEVRLARKMDQARVAVRDEKRAKTSAVLPIIEEDYAKTVQHMEQVSQSLEQARQAIEQPFQRPQLGMNDAIAAGISGIFGGATGFNQALGGAYERSDQDYAQNYQMQRQNAMLDYERAVQEVDFSRRKMDALRGAYLDAVQSGDEFERRIALEEMRKAAEEEQMAQEHANKLELEQTKQENLNYRAELNDPRTREIAKRLAATPEGAQALGVLLGYDQRTIDALNAETALEKLRGAQADLTKEKAATEKETRPGKVANLNAGVALKISQMFLNDARRGEIEQRVAYYPQEFQAKIADTYSLIDQRSKGRVGGGENYYYGKGDETAIRSGMNSANKTIAALMMKATTGGGLTPEESAALKTAQEDSALFSQELKKVEKAKTDRVRSKYSGQGISTGGGADALNRPAVVSPPANQRVSGAMMGASMAGQMGRDAAKKPAPKKAAKPAKKPKFEFIED